MKRRILYIINLTLLLLTAKIAIATKGGTEEIEILGYDKQTKKIYFFYHYNNESGCWPDLLECDIETKTLTIYRGCEVNSDNISLNLTKASSSTKYSDQSFSIKEFPEFTIRDKFNDYDYKIFPLEIALASRVIKINQCFRKDSLPVIVGQNEIPSEDFGFVIIRYFGLCYETGYNKDTVVFFPEIKKILHKPMPDKFITEVLELNDTSAITSKIDEEDKFSYKQEPDLFIDQSDQSDNKKNRIWIVLGLTLLLFLMVIIMWYKKRTK